MWTKSYSNIRRTNVFGTCRCCASFGGIKTANQEKQGFTAWYYSILLKFCRYSIIGNTVYTASDIIYTCKNTYEKCVDYMVKELDTAAALFTSSLLSQDYGRITKGACLGLKSRYYIRSNPLFNGGSMLLTRI